MRCGCVASNFSPQAEKIASPSTYALFEKEYTMKTLAIALGMAIAASNGMAHAEDQDHNMSQHQMSMQRAAEPGRHEGIGVLKAVNKEAGKVQIAHEAIADLSWPAMNMWFILNCPLPGDIRVGDPVRFELMQDEKKHWMVVTISRK
jgi:Cu/Ag efflux protein CusF